MQPTIQANEITEDSYIERNRRWLLPLVENCLRYGADFSHSAVTNEIHSSTMEVVA
jgi:hypothetical protein